MVALGRALPSADVALMQARGLVLAEDVRAMYSVPPFTSAATTGFALRQVDVTVGKALPVVDNVPAGRSDVPTLQPGTAIRVMAGAPLSAPFSTSRAMVLT